MNSTHHVNIKPSSPVLRSGGYLSLHINNTYAKKRGIAKNLLLAVRTPAQQIDLVAGDFNGAAGAPSGSDSRPKSSNEEAFVNTNLALAPYRCGDQKACQVNGRMCVGS